MNNVLITGTSSGLGYSLAKALKDKYNVYGLSRSKSDLDIVNIECDLTSRESIDNALKQIPTSIKNFEYVILNAGMLGRLKPIEQLTEQEFEDTMMTNFLSNKIILDTLMSNFKVNTVFGISSGASEKPYYGWSLYCCSKAAFRQLLNVYSVEKTDTSFYSVCPGPFKSKMQDYIYIQDESEIPSVEKFKKMHKDLISSDKMAEFIVTHLNIFDGISSGAYVDLRKVQDDLLLRP